MAIDLGTTTITISKQSARGVWKCSPRRDKTLASARIAK
jgi:hypothetical protein